MQVYLKAIYAGVIAGLGSTSSAYVQGSGHIGVVAGCTIAMVTLTAFWGVLGVANKPTA